MAMKFVKTVLVVLALALVGGILATGARADQWNKKTVVTFNQPLQIPGHVLPAGTYTFKLYDSSSDRNIVQVWNEDGTELIATILAIPNYRLEPTGETVLTFRERPTGTPEALRAWFYPGEKFGQEFVYPKEEAVRLAETSKEIVPAETIEPTESNLKTVPLIAVTPEKREEPISEAFQTTPPPTQEKLTPAPTAVAQAKELPKTASPIPLIALFGLISVGLAFGVKLLAKRVS